MFEDIIDKELLQELITLSKDMQSRLGIWNRIAKAAEETAELSAALSKLNAAYLPSESDVAKHRILKELCDCIFTLIPVLLHLESSMELRGLIDYNLREVIFKNKSLLYKVRHGI